MKILIIHPSDRSTDFLKPIYQSLLREDDDKFVKRITLITGGISKNKLRELIDKHDQIIMLGHGSPLGLFSVDQFENTQGGYIVDDTMVAALGTKQNIFIWCNADKFVNKYYLKGFYTGMFISEMGEAEYMGVRDTNQEMINESNNEFVKIVGNWVNQPLDELYRYVKDRYSTFALTENKTNYVAIYNANRLYYK